MQLGDAVLRLFGSWWRADSRSEPMKWAIKAQHLTSISPFPSFFLVLYFQEVGTIFLLEASKWLFFFFLFSQTFYCVALANLELPLKTRLALNLRDPTTSASWVLGFKASAALPSLSFSLVCVHVLPPCLSPANLIAPNP